MPGSMLHNMFSSSHSSRHLSLAIQRLELVRLDEHNSPAPLLQNMGYDPLPRVGRWAAFSVAATQSKSPYLAQWTSITYYRKNLVNNSALGRMVSSVLIRSSFFPSRVHLLV